jgi:hypothetical protein
VAWVGRRCEEREKGLTIAIFHMKDKQRVKQTVMCFSFLVPIDIQFKLNMASDP